MKFETKYFGTVEVPPDEVITFPNGLFGFEEERSFLLLPFAGSDGNMLCLQSAATPSLAFIAMNPFSLHPSYQPLLSSEELREMEVKDSHALCYYVLCVVREPVQESTLNFKCPVVVNPDSRRAIQVILESDAYHMRHRLGGVPGGKGGHPMLILGRKAGESLTIGGDISITVLSVDSGGNVSLGIQAPKEMLILRSELQQAVSSNQEAAQSPSTPQLLASLESAFRRAEAVTPPSGPHR